MNLSLVLLLIGVCAHSGLAGYSTFESDVQAIEIGDQIFLFDVSENDFTYGFDKDTIKQILDKALGSFSPIVRTLVNKALDLVGGNLDKLQSRAASLFKFFGLQSVWAQVDSVINQVRKAIREKIPQDELLTMSFESQNDFTYGLDKDTIKQILDKALGSFSPIVRTLVNKALDYVGGNLDKLQAQAASLFSFFGLDAVWTQVDVVINQVRKAIRDKIPQDPRGEWGDYPVYSPNDAQYGWLSDTWDKVQAAVQNMKGAAKKTVQEAINKYKPQIIDGLNRVKEVVIDAKNRIVISIRNEIVRIITGAETAQSTAVSTYGFTDLWNKVKDAAKKLVGQTKTIVIKVINDNKAAIMAELQKMKQTLIDAGKKVLIEIVNDVVKIIVGDNISYSATAVSTVSNDLAYGWTDIWDQVKVAAGKLKGILKVKVIAAIEKNKPLIIDSLNKIKEVIIDAGKKVLISVRENIVRIIAGADISQSTAVATTYGWFGDVWDKVKDAAGKLAADVKAVVEKAIKDNKPLIESQLKKLGAILINAGKTILIQIVKDGVKIIVGEFATYSV